MKKRLLWTAGILVVLVAAFGLIQYLASERVEVVVLKTAAGSETRLWIVDHDDHTYLRAGTPEAGWYAEVRANPVIMVERSGGVMTYRAVPRPELRDLINRLMREKYSWGDRFISAMISRDEAVPIELQSSMP